MRKNCIITLAILTTSSAFCFLIQRFTSSDTHVPLLFVLAVLMISRFTDGYLYGILASVVAVIGVNYMFTYPYFEVNFSITGYPLTFLAMLAVSVIVSTLTTQIKQQEQIRLEIEKEKMRANLLRAVSHDIRTPLTSIVGSASGIIDNYQVLSDEHKLTLLKDIRDEAQWLIRSVENLLSITRINGENAQIKTEEEAVEEIISSAVLKFRKRYPNIEVSVEMPPDFLMVSMDGILIEQVLVNLLENSVQHGKTTSRIWIHVLSEPSRITVQVQDNGQGIRESILPVMFDGNFRPDEEQEFDGKRNMGIGLSVCKSIVNAHKGNMKAENNTTGALITFWLPVGKGENDGYQGQNLNH